MFHVAPGVGLASMLAEWDGLREERSEAVQLPRDEASLEGRWWKERSRQKRVEEGVSIFRNQGECRVSDLFDY